MCEKHYKRLKTHGDPTVVKPSWHSRPKNASAESLNSKNGICGEDGCNEPEHARGWCKKHHSHWLKYGTPNMMREFTCVICSKAWVAESKRGLPPRVCSSECFKEMQRANARKRRAVYNLPESELISLQEIYERDKRVCYLCGEKVQRKDASMDHVVPISKGGPHMRENIKLAHLKCNMKKHDRLLSELKVIQPYLETT